MNVDGFFKALEFDQKKCEEVVSIAKAAGYDPNMSLLVWKETVHIEAKEGDVSSFEEKPTWSFITGHSSTKPRNYVAVFSLKRLLGFVVSTYLTTSMPETINDTIKLGLYIVYNAITQMNIKLSDPEVAVLRYLDEKNAYEYPVDEQKIYADLPAIKAEDINRLYKIQCINIDKGKVWLKETVLF